MEFVEAKALKSSVRSELTLRTTQQALLLDDFNSSNGAVAAEDFSVDCFLDFSNPELEDGFIERDEEEEEEEEEGKGSVSATFLDGPVDDDNNSNFSGFSSESLPSDELSLPVDDYVLAGLEWVSRFVDDSLPGIHGNYHVVDKHLEKGSEPEPEPVFVETPGLPLAVPAKARTKRSKPNGRVWSGLSGLVLVNTDIAMEMPGGLIEPPRKKLKRKPRVQVDESDDGNPLQRRCSHCQVQKTPQWRTGPLGPKTLCNACGVRYKSGRLFPEYRPACSPSFSGDVHSNSHRKVLEIRRRKESVQGDSGLTRMVQSF